MGSARLFTAALLATGSLALEIIPAPVWPASERCTDKSLTIPSWVISKYKVTGGNTYFHAENRAHTSGESQVGNFDCTPDGKCQPWAASSQWTASISKDASGNPVVSLSELWMCGDTVDKYAIFIARSNLVLFQP